MEDLTFIATLLLAGITVLYYVMRVSWDRLCAVTKEEQQRSVGTGFDSSLLLGRIRQVRQQPVAEIPSYRSNMRRRRCLLAWAHAAVAKLSYFRDQQCNQ